MCVCVCLSVCMHISGTVRRISPDLLCILSERPWLGCVVMELQYVVYLQLWSCQLIVSGVLELRGQWLCVVWATWTVVVCCVCCCAVAMWPVVVCCVSYVASGCVLCVSDVEGCNSAGNRHESRHVGTEDWDSHQHYERRLTCWLHTPGLPVDTCSGCQSTLTAPCYLAPLLCIWLVYLTYHYANNKRQTNYVKYLSSYTPCYLY